MPYAPGLKTRTGIQEGVNQPLQQDKASGVSRLEGVLEIPQGHVSIETAGMSVRVSVLFSFGLAIANVIVVFCLGSTER